MQNVRICKIMNIIIIIMNIIIDNNVNVFIYCITYLLNRYMENCVDSARIEVEVKITSDDLYVHSDCTRNKKKSKLKVVHKYTRSKSLLNKRSKC